MQRRRGFLGLVALLWTLIAGLAVGGESPWRVTQTIAVDAEVWRWNWASWDQDKIATVGDYQYTVFWDADGVFVLVRRDLRDNRVQTLRLPSCKLSNDDAHRNTCLGTHDLLFDANNRLHATWVYREIAATWASNHDLHYA